MLPHKNVDASALASLLASILAINLRCKLKSCVARIPHMETSLTPSQARTKIRKRIKEMFADLLAEVRNGKRSLPDVAKQIGLTRQMLEQYAGGSIPKADVLLTAFLKWDWILRIDNRGGTPAWCEFGMSDLDKDSKKLKHNPVQLSLFDALEELDIQLEVLRKSVAKAESEIERSLQKSA